MSDTAELEELNRGYIRSVQESDGAWFERHLAADFVNQNPDCTISDRGAFIAFVSRPCAVSGLRAEDVRIQRLGDIAIIFNDTATTEIYTLALHDALPISVWLIYGATFAPAPDPQAATLAPWLIEIQIGRAHV